MTDLKGYTEKLLNITSFVFVVLLPLDLKILSPILILLLVLATFQYDKNNWKINDKRYRLYYIAFVILFGCIAISLLWTANLHAGLKQLEHRVFFLGAPLLFYLVRKLPIEKLMRLFVISMFITCVFCFGHLVYFFFTEKSYFIDRTIRGGISKETFTYLIFHGRNNFIAFDVHRTYYSFSLLIGLVFLLFGTSKVFTSKALTLFVIFLFSFVIFLLQAKVTVVLLVFVMGLAFIFKTKKMSVHKKVVWTMLFGIVLFSGLYLSKPRFARTAKELNQISVKTEGSLIERLQYTKCSLELIRESPIFGYGFGDVNDVIKDKLVKYDYVYLLNKKTYDPHNEFLKTFIGLGFVGFFVFTSAFILPFYKARKKKNIMLMIFVFMVFAICLVEPFLSRQGGILPTLFFIGLLAGLEKTKNEYSHIV